MKFIKKYIKIIVLILTCLLIYMIYSKTSTNNITYLSLGDGYAMGINCYGVKDYGYSDYLKDYLEKNNKLHKYYNDFSYKEIRINDLYKDILINKENNNGENLKQALRSSNLLTISIGLNDLVYKTSITGKLSTYQQKIIINDIKTDYKKLINEIQKYYKYDIYIIGYNNFYPQNTVERNMLDNLNDEIKKLSTEKNIKYVETNSLFTKNSGYLENPNSNFPNTNGYYQIYNKIIEKITL